MRRRCVLFDRMAVITLMVLLMLGGAQAWGEDENPTGLSDVQPSKDQIVPDIPLSEDQTQCFILAFLQFARDLVGHRFTLLAVQPDAGGPGICEIDFFRYDTNTLFRARVDLLQRLIISTEVTPNTQPAASPAEIAEARSMAEVGALADRIAATPELMVTALSGSVVFSSDEVCVRCIDLVYYGAAGTGTAPAEEPAGESVTFTDQEVVATAVVDMTNQIVLRSEVFP